MADTPTESSDEAATPAEEVATAPAPQGDADTETAEQEEAPADDGLTDALMDLIISIRQEARAAKNWAVADKIRDGLKEAGVVLEDTPTGVRWKRA